MSEQPDMFGGPPAEPKVTRRTRILNELPPTEIKPADPNRPEGQSFTGLESEAQRKASQASPFERSDNQEAA